MKENKQVAKTATSSLKQSFNNKKNSDKKQKTQKNKQKNPHLTKMNGMESLCSDSGKGKNTIQSALKQPQQK